eukprot:gene1445-2788_t
MLSGPPAAARKNTPNPSTLVRCAPAFSVMAVPPYGPRDDVWAGSARAVLVAWGARCQRRRSGAAMVVKCGPGRGPRQAFSIRSREPLPAVVHEPFLGCRPASSACCRVPAPLSSLRPRCPGRDSLQPASPCQPPAPMHSPLPSSKMQQLANLNAAIQTHVNNLGSAKDSKPGRARLQNDLQSCPPPSPNNSPFPTPIQSVHMTPRVTPAPSPASTAVPSPLNTPGITPETSSHPSPRPTPPGTIQPSPLYTPIKTPAATPVSTPIHTHLTPI